MAIKTRTQGTTSAKKLVIILASEGLLVPAMQVTLISPKSLFRLHGIRTYFNDELKFCLPNGDVVSFIETERNYLILLEEGVEYDKMLDQMEKGHMRPITNASHGHSCFDSNKVTLVQPLPLTSDLLHERIMHFSWDKCF